MNFIFQTMTFAFWFLIGILILFQPKVTKIEFGITWVCLMVWMAFDISKYVF